MREARIINNCFEETNGQNQIKKAEKRNKMNNNKKYYAFHPYICVIAIFDEVDANKKNFNVNLQYEYIAQNILRYKETSTNPENTVVWYYDNYKRIQPIDNIKFNLELVHNNIIKMTNADKEKNKLTGYPDKFKGSYDTNKNSTVFSWDLNTIGENDYQKISIDMPMYNKKCRKLVYF